MSFYGIPPISAAGTYIIQLTVRDPFGAQVVDSFELKVNAKPAAPTSGSFDFIDKEFRISQGTFTLKLSNHFQDPDTSQGDTLTYSIKQASGLGVGSWVQLAPSTGIVTLNAGINNVGWNYFVASASDRSGASFS